MRRNNDIAARIFGFILVLLGTLWVAIQMPKVQTGLAERVVDSLEKKLDGQISFSNISIKPFNAISLSDVVIVDNDPYTEDINNTGYAPADTFFRAEKVTASISLKSLLKRNGVYINRAYVKNAMMHLVNEPREGYGTNMQRIFQMKKKDKPKTRGSANIFEINKLQADNLNFRMTNFKSTKPYKGSGINWKDMDVSANISGRKIKYTGGRMSGIADHIDLREKSGYTCEDLSGKAIVGMGKTTLQKVHLKDPWSDVDISNFEMNYENTGSFKHFMEDVRLKLKGTNGTLSTKTIEAICGALEGKDLSLDIKDADASGYVNDLEIKKLDFTEPNSAVSGKISGRVTGLPKTGNLLLDTEVENLDFTTAGLSKLVKQVAPGAKVNLGKYLPGQKLKFNGTAKGHINNLDANGTLRTSDGKLNANVNVKNLANKARPTEISGKFGSNNFDLSGISGAESLGDCAVDTRFKAVLDGKNTSVTIDSVLIDKFNFNGYEYKNIKCQGEYADNAFDGHIECNDPNLKLSFDGLATLPSKKKGISTGVYDFAADIDYADLKALNIDPRDGSSKVSMSLNSNFSVTGKDDISGTVDVYNLVLANDKGTHEIGDLKLRSTTNEGQQTIIFNSEFADASFQGSRKFTDLIKDIQSVTTRRELPALYSKDNPDTGNKDSYYSLTLNTHDTRDVLAYAMPGLYIADSSRVVLKMERDGSLAASLNSSRLAWKTDYIKDADITLDNQDNSLNAIITSSEMSLKNIGFKNSAFTAFAQNNNYFGGFHYDGIEGIDNFGEIYLSGQIERDQTDTLVVTANPLSSYLDFSGSRWDIDESQIIYRAGNAKFNGVNMHNEEQQITINGGISANQVDTLRLDVNDVDISVINYFTAKDYDFKGRTSGIALLSSPMKGNKMRALLNLECDSLHVSSQDAGSLKLAGVWDKASDKIYMFVSNIIDGRDAINAKGSFNTASKYIDLNASLDEMNPVLATPFISSILSDMSGGISGEIIAKGTPDSLAVSSDGTRFNNAKFKINYTNVAYTLEGPFHVDNSGLWFDSVNIYDKEGGRGVIGGGVALKEGGKIELATKMRLSDLMVIDTGYGNNFYGTLYASGNAYASGPTDAILVEADVLTSKDGTLHIPLGGASSAKTSDLLTFTDHSEAYYDPYEDMLSSLYSQGNTNKKKAKGGIIAHAKVNTTPEMTAYVELDSSGDNVLSANGSGTISIDVETAKSLFEIGGDYNISSGKYHFAIPGIVSKDFSIDDGSSISFNGDIMESLLNINATYSLRTGINALIADTSSVSTRRMVNCGIHISDKLSSPTVHFSIDIPDLDPVTKAEVESALNTEDKVQKQFLSLLITGSFITSETSGVVNNNSLLYSNMSEVMSRQLSNILGKLDIPVDLGVGYQQSSSGTNLFDVEVSTELFDNRVIVNGSLGNRQYTNTGNPNGDVVGDLDIDIKLDKRGEVRLNLFSHSADEYTSYLDYSQRNGAGVSYQKEFSTWKRLWKSITRKKHKDKMPPERSEFEMPDDLNEIIKLEGNE